MALAATIFVFGLENDFCLWSVLKKSVLDLGFEHHVLDSTSAIYDVYQSAWKSWFCLPNRFQKIILVFGPTLLVVTKICCFDEWLISSFIKDKAMINSAYVKKQITIEHGGSLAKSIWEFDVSVRSSSNYLFLSFASQKN